MAQSSEAKGDLPLPSSAREIIHDLRNLFAVIASIQHLMTRSCTATERAELLRGLGEAALRGGELASRLLCKNGSGKRRLLDVGVRVADAVPMLQAIARPRTLLEIDTQVALPAALVNADPAELEAVLIELVTNAKAAGARRVMLRCRRIGNRIWLMIADDGTGLLPNPSLKSPGRADETGHGLGLPRVRRAVRDMNGKLLIRSSISMRTGTIIAMLLPVALGAVGKSCAREWSTSPLQAKESCDEDGRTVAA